jgi:hypothetical protein
MATRRYLASRNVVLVVLLYALLRLHAIAMDDSASYDDTRPNLHRDSRRTSAHTRAHMYTDGENRSMHTSANTRMDWLPTQVRTATLDGKKGDSK